MASLNFYNSLKDGDFIKREFYSESEGVSICIFGMMKKFIPYWSDPERGYTEQPVIECHHLYSSLSGKEPEDNTGDLFIGVPITKADDLTTDDVMMMTPDEIAWFKDMFNLE